MTTDAQEQIGAEHRMHPASLANLRPPWRPGESGNPDGRPRCGSVVKDWLNQFAADGTTPAELATIIADRNEPATKIAAAQRLLRATKEDGLTEFTAVCEQTDGKPSRAGTLELTASVSTDLDFSVSAAEVEALVRMIEGSGAHEPPTTLPETIQ